MGMLSSTPIEATMPTLIFRCPECNEAIPARVEAEDEGKKSTKTVRLYCLKIDGRGCGWIGYVPASWGKRY